MRHGDLYAATEGRAFWALDDLSALRQMSAQVHGAAGAPVHATPCTARRRAVAGDDDGRPQSAVRRERLLLARHRARLRVARVKLEFLDGAGKVLQTYARSSGVAAGTPPAAAGSVRRRAPRLEPKAGLNAFQWDLRAEPPTTLPGGHRDVRRADERVSRRAGALSGTPHGRHDGAHAAARGSADPRLTVAAAEVAARDSMARAINARIGEINDALIRVRDVKDQVTRFVDRAKDAPNADGHRGQGQERSARRSTRSRPKLSTKAANGQDIINFRNGINAQYVFLLGNVEGNDVLTQPVRERFAELERLWGALRAQVDVLEQQDVPAFNKLLEDGKVEGVIVPKPKPKVVM